MTKLHEDLSGDARWNLGCDFAMTQLCGFLGVDPKKVTWDAATETVEGDVQAVIGNIFRARFGEDWTLEALASVTEDGDAELMKPRGNGGIVSPEICFNCLLLTGDANVPFETMKGWTQDQLDTAYDWAIRTHLNASDNDDVIVPPRPAHVTVRS